MSPADLAYRQELRNLNQLVDHSRGIIPRRSRKAFERFLAHADERVRAYAAGVARADEEARLEYRRLLEEDERLAEEAEARFQAELENDESASQDHVPLDDDIPF